MTFKTQYVKKKDSIIEDKAICKDNRDLFKKFLDWEEVKLKRTNGLRALDENCYKTLYTYLTRLVNINSWFKNKPLKSITKKDLEKVYNDLEDGKIKNKNGLPFQDRQSYYNKIFKSKPFEIIGKDKLAREVIQYYRNNKEEVRFIEEDDFKKLVKYPIRDEQKLLFWLAWDIGENVNSLLQLKKSDFLKQKSSNTDEHEYRVNLPKEILKRSRTSRSEITNYTETVKLLDDILFNLKDDDDLFNFDYRNALKIFTRAVKKSGIKCKPKGQKPTWKDLRSGMACSLLKKGWTTDEVNARLGHKPSSQQLDKYINFLALDRHIPKKKLYDSQLQNLMKEIEDMKTREKLKEIRVNNRLEEVDVKIEKFEKWLKLSKKK